MSRSTSPATTSAAGSAGALYGALFELLERQGVHELCAGVTLPNAPSVGLHESLGFAPVGVYRDIAYKFGRWHSVGWWQMGAARAPRWPGARRARAAPARLQPR